MVFRQLTLDDVATEITVGHVGSMASEYQNTGIPFLRSLNVLPYVISKVDIRYISPEFHSRLKKSALRPGDVVIVRTGNPGTCAVVPEWLNDANCSDLVIVRCGQAIRPRYLSYWVNSLAAHHIGSSLVGAVQQHFNVGSARQMPILLPALEEQDRILNLVASLDDKIELNRRMNETLEAMAQAIFRDWFVDFGPTRRKIEGATDPVEILGGLVADPERARQLADLFPDAVGDAGLPQGWKETPISNLVQFNPSEPLKRGTVAPYADMASLPTNGSLADAPIEREFNSGMRFRNGDALVARITPCLENGKAAFVDFLVDDLTVGWGSTEFIVLRAIPPVPSPFSYLLVRHPEFRDRAIRSMTGTSGRQRAQVDAVANFQFAHPPVCVHKAFGEFVVPFFKQISANGRQNYTLAAMRDLLLPKLMSGEIRLRDAERQLAEVA